ncbi:biotin--[acetyl-CoA-carboxylase] ligase [Adlercreutzia sp. ZJ141]|uniref:biotin--[acetyl-CoA-carboxylase] ligase n=1 Tax=Adlercreutzia sp. ZJ141 TaxID=2709406 RepID=UPI0013EB9E69|nr:biotin--[acetyl-CoA-carboxylase] ligase [Adlercreutzia sp. ZJ141]
MFRIRELNSVDSTNNQVKCALEAGEAEGLVVRALRQTGGYGRQGRAWLSPFGGMYQSLLLRPRVPAVQLPTLSLVVGLGVRDALAGLVSAERAQRIKVKWPNDVVYVPHSGQSAEQSLTFQKLCGISLEAHAGGVCVGIGVNVVSPERAACAGYSLKHAACAGHLADSSACADHLTEGFSPNRFAQPSHSSWVAGKNTPAYLVDLGLDAADVQTAVSCVGDAVLQSVLPLYNRWCEQGFAAFVDEFSAHAALDGKEVRIANIHGGVTQVGVVAGVDEYGRLLLQTSDGARCPVSSGEAHIL